MAVSDTVETRVCTHCHETKPLTVDHFYRNGHNRGTQRWKSVCIPCRAVIRAEERAALSAEELKRERAYERESKRLQRVTEEGRRRDAEISRRWRKNMSTNPDRVEAHREARRLQARRRRERASAEEQLAPIANWKAGRSLMPRLPARPLAEKLDEMIKRSNVMYSMHDPLHREGSGATKEICAQVGIADRQLTAWRNREIILVHFDIADRVLQNAGWLWWDVFDEESVRLPIIQVVRRQRRKPKRKGQSYWWVTLPPQGYGDRGTIPVLDVEGYEVTDHATLAVIEHAFTGEDVTAPLAGANRLGPPPGTRTIEEYEAARAERRHAVAA